MESQQPGSKKKKKKQNRKGGLELRINFDELWDELTEDEKKHAAGQPPLSSAPATAVALKRRPGGDSDCKIVSKKTANGVVTTTECVHSDL